MQFPKCQSGQRAVENPCKVFPGKRSYRPLRKHSNVGVENYTFPNETEQKSWKSPQQSGTGQREGQQMAKVTQQERDPSQGAGPTSFVPLPHLVLLSGALLRQAGGAPCTPPCPGHGQSHAHGHLPRPVTPLTFLTNYKANVDRGAACAFLCVEIQAGASFVFTYSSHDLNEVNWCSKKRGLGNSQMKVPVLLQV